VPALDFLTAPLRSLLGLSEQAEREVVQHSPLHETRELEAKLAEAVAAVHRSCDSMERHIAVLETLADSLAPLTASVTRLTDELAPLVQLAAPIGQAGREVGRVEHFFSRHRHHEEAPPEPGGPPAPQPGGPPAPQRGGPPAPQPGGPPAPREDPTS
jgi:hypothetical protein